MAIQISPQQPTDVTPPSSFLEVRDLRVHFPTEDGLVKSVDGVSFSLEKGKTLGIVGESGSGKSVTSLALLGLHKGSRAQVSGQVWLDGEELVALPESEMRGLRGNKVSMIFQDPLSSLHPFFTVGSQIAEAYRVHHDVSKKEAKERAVEMLKRVGIPQPERRVKDYPHQFSGGMRQRAMIAMSLVCDPELLIADEPTTALDVTVQAQILDLIGDLQEEFGSAVIIITHDLGVVAEVSDDILVMYGGRRIEYGTVREVLQSPEHPYTWGLLQSMPKLGGDVNERLNPIQGTPPSLINLPSGCAFHPRCTFKDRVPDGRCLTERPELLPIGDSPRHLAACHLTSATKLEIRGGAPAGGPAPAPTESATPTGPEVTAEPEEAEEAAAEETAAAESGTEAEAEADAPSKAEETEESADNEAEPEGKAESEAEEADTKADTKADAKGDAESETPAEGDTPAETRTAK